MAENGNKLSANQRRAIGALLASKSIREAADRANLGERTLHRYLSDPSFCAELDRLQGEMIGQGVRWLAAELESVLGIIADIGNDPEIAPATRLAAAKAWIQAIKELMLVHSFEQRLDRLEEATFGKH